MAKPKVRFVCSQCQAVYSKWSGSCEQCGQWNSLVEVEQAAPAGASVVERSAGQGTVLAASSFAELPRASDRHRLRTGLADLDMVLGGGLVAGGVVLLAGQPGIGKSTLLLQIAAMLAQNRQVLYISGEESADQVRLRAVRLGAAGQAVQFAASTSADDIAATIRSGAYDLVVVDSIQTVSLAEVASAPGTVGQITNASTVIIRAAKATGTAVIMVGHVTKEGAIAGPKVLEHVVDVVLQFEGDRYGGFKVVRAAKNRYGSTNQAALFEMTKAGLAAVANPSAALLEERRDQDGSVVLATLEGMQPLLVEIQALVNPTHFGYPKRTASGFDVNRLNLLIAVLERRTKLNLSDKDIYINVVGGLRLSDPAADLAVVMAIASASAGRKLPSGTVVFGEVGLGGEVRSVVGSDKRLAEAHKLGFDRALAPRTRQAAPSGVITIQGVDDVRSALINYLQK